MKLSSYPINSISLCLTATTLATLLLNYPLEAIAKTSQESIQISVLTPVLPNSIPRDGSGESRPKPPPRPPVPEAPGGQR